MAYGAELNFEKRDDLQAWLEQQPVAFSRAIAARAVLRVAPIAVRFGRQLAYEHQYLTLSIFRATLIAWTACRWPESAIDLRAAAEGAAKAPTTATFAIRSIAPRAAADAASFAVRSLAESATLEVSAAATSAVVFAARAADYTNAYLSIWETVSRDAQSLADHGKDFAPTLLVEPLWPKRVPVWAVRAWRDMKSTLEKDDPNWQVWTNWYEALLSHNGPVKPNRLVSKSIALRIAGQGDDFWGPTKEPRRSVEVNKEIMEWWEAERRSLSLASAQQQSIGNKWAARENHLHITQEVFADDIEAANDPTTRKAHASLIRKAEDFSAAARKFEDHYGWSGFTADFDRLKAGLCCQSDALAENAWEIYDTTLTIASYLQQDNDNRRGAVFSNAALSAEHRRQFTDFVRSLAPFVRRFPTVAKEDENAANFLQRISVELSRSLLDSAHCGGVITDKDRDLMAALLAAMERNGLPAEKAGIRAHFSIRNLAFVAAMFVASTVAQGTAQKMVLYDKVTDWLAERGDEVTEIVADAPADIRATIEAILEDVKREKQDDGDDLPDPAIEPDGASRRRRRRV